MSYRFSYLHILSPSSLFASPLPLPPTPHTQSDPILISTLLPFSANSGDSAGEGGGWSDLPSDHEDTWFFSEDEAEEFEREQKRRRLDAMRLARLQQRKEEEGTASDGEDNDADKGKGKEWAEDEVVRSFVSPCLSWAPIKPALSNLEQRINVVSFFPPLLPYHPSPPTRSPPLKS
jgi:hypothetical protein